ncbi:hypothetical protein HDU89_000431 [Geranomyces variabilis]|nr:hypothetical protein HDU89_000431 [Geranomyces variabilis]
MTYTRQAERGGDLYRSNRTCAAAKVAVSVAAGRGGHHCGLRLSHSWPALQSTYLESLMYQGSAVAACIRHLRHGGNVGCQAEPGTTGILYMLTDQSDVAKFTATAPDAKYAVVIPYTIFNRANVQALRASGKMSGIILVKSGTGFATPDAWSPDSPTPNAQYGLYANQSEDSWHAWNPAANSMAFDSFDFPIFGITNSPTNLQSAVPVIEAAMANKNKGHSSYPLYAVEFDAFMYAADDAETCLRRGFCDPVGAVSVWSSFTPYLNANPDTKKPIVLVSAKLDSTSFIHDWGFIPSGASLSPPVFAVGADPKTGLVAALAVAAALGQYLRAPNSTALAKDIVFTFFDAEAWGFAGSQRFVKDITTPQTCLEAQAPTSACPTSDATCSKPCHFDLDFQSVKIDNIDSIIEFDTVGGIGAADQTIYMHVDQQSAANLALMDAFKGGVVTPAVNGSVPQTMNIVAADAGARLPPSSAMAFLQKRNIPAVVLSDYNTQFSNRYYNSEFDDGTTWNATTISNICALANATAQSIFKIASGNATVPAAVLADCNFVQTLMDCFTRNLSCSFLAQFFPLLGQLGLSQLSADAGPFNFNLGVLSYVVSRIIQNVTATDRGGACAVDSDCPTDFACLIFSTPQSGQCVKGFVRYHWAYGTGIEMNYGSSSFEVVDPTKATWTQSQYRDSLSTNTGVQLRIFQASSTRYAGLQLGVGLAVTLFAVGATIALKVYSKRRFKTD